MHNLKIFTKQLFLSTPPWAIPWYPDPKLPYHTAPYRDGRPILNQPNIINIYMYTQYNNNINNNNNNFSNAREWEGGGFHLLTIPYKVNVDFFTRENRLFICRATLSPWIGERVHEDMWRDKFARVEIFQLGSEFRVMTANQPFNSVATEWRV